MTTCVSSSYQEQSKRGHEAFFSQLPRATVVFLIDLLEAAEVDVQHAGVDDAESETKNDQKTQLWCSAED